MSNDPFDAGDLPLHDAPLGLPRLRVIHLMLWMAATAVALVPFQLQQQQGQARLTPTGAMASAPAMALGSAYGVAAGGFLFITTALACWKWRGRAFRLEPGHWLAIQGAVQWILWTATWVALFTSEQPLTVLRALQIPRLLLGIAFFLIYLRLAVRAGEPALWRWTFLALAVVPAVAAFYAMFAPFFGWSRGQVAAVVLPQGAAAATIGLFILLALLRDMAGGAARHWTHWLGAGMRLAVFGSTTAMSLYYGLNPGALNR